MSGLFLGIDTSNYKTSVAVTDCGGNVIYQKSELLPVKQGQRGLRQETAFFMHNTRLPDYLSEAFKVIEPEQLLALGVSDAPRRAEGSYMPVFMAGVNAAEILGSALRIPVYRFSHQEGHIESILSGTDIKAGDTFIQFHLSGGTSECLRCTARTDAGYDCEIIGGTKDISIGQLIDRIGVKLDFPFPAGPYLDRIACDHPVTYMPKKVKLNDGYFNLSGIETELIRASDECGETVVPGMFTRISELIRSTALYLADKYEINNVYIAGGVASSAFLRRYMEESPAEGISLQFGDPVLSGDNAVGISLLGGKAYLNENGNRNTGK